MRAIKSLTCLIMKKRQTHQRSPPQSLPTLGEYQTSKWLDTPTTVWSVYLLQPWQPFYSQPLEGGGCRVISIHLWVTRSSGY